MDQFAKTRCRNCRHEAMCRRYAKKNGFTWINCTLNRDDVVFMDNVWPRAGHSGGVIWTPSLFLRLPTTSAK